MKRIFICLAVILASVTVIAAVLLSNNVQTTFSANINALAAGEIPATGTCCYEYGSICCIGDYSFAHYYYKKEGSCKN